MTLIYILHLFLPVVVLVLWLLGLVGISPSGRFSFIITGKVSRVIGLMLPFVLGVVAVSFSYNGQLKRMLEIDYYGCQNKWPEVLHAAKGHPGYKFPSKMVDRAMYHTGHLTDDMFSYPQGVEALFMDRRAGGIVFWELPGVFLDIGQVNLAEYALFVCLETYGERPILLRQLALVDMVKGNMARPVYCLGR